MCGSGSLSGSKRESASFTSFGQIKSISKWSDMRFSRVPLLLAIASVLWNAGVDAQPAWLGRMQKGVHNQGNLQLPFNNLGGWGDSGSVDVLTGARVDATTYPRNSRNDWGGAEFVFGGVVDRETLTCVLEWLPDEPPDNRIRYQTIDRNSVFYSPEARSNLDAIVRLNDSLDDPNETLVRGNRPLFVRAIRRTMAWGASNIDDFVLVETEISSIGKKTIKNCVLGLWTLSTSKVIYSPFESNRSVAGSLRSSDQVETCGVPDSADLFYWMDADGDPQAGQWGENSILGAVGIRLLGSSVEEPTISYTWSTSIDRLYWAGLKQKTARALDNCNTNDCWFYTVLTSGDRSYDQFWMAHDSAVSGWTPRSPDGATLAAGGEFTYLHLGVGPFDLGPGQKVHFTYAIVGGENVHVNPTDFADYWDPYHPEVYYSKLDFTELMTNARWAKWVYDNPGVDTDGDGFFGKYRVCDGDTNWYEGDGVPDFRADIPPPSPKLKVIPSLNSLTLRWNGYYSENAIDPFTKVKDFEGYRVYLGLDDRESSYSTLISWDYPNYNRYYLREKPNHTFVWETKDLPFTIDSLKSIYGDDFYPLQYTKDNPLHVGDTQYAFLPVDYNLSSLISNGVHKVYPEAINPGTDTMLWTEDQLTTEHGNSLPKYYEYEYTIDNLLPTIPYYLSVSSFDFGYSKGNIPAKESSKRENQTIAYAQTPADSVLSQNLDVYVYPNPYIWQKDYHSLGYENIDNTQIPDRSHRINFGNLPPRCKISIFSLDGDLIRSWDHNFDPNDPQAMHDAWDLITRNTMLPVAGLYYWVVESEGRTQIGKFVIIM